MTKIRSFLLLVVALSAPTLAQEPIKIGLVTALSGQSARAGEAITRGVTIAIDELNAKGGVLKGRKFELVRRDDEATPAKGVTAARELLFKEKVAVLFGGLDTPVSLAIVPIVNQEKIPFMGPWAAGTPITKNGANPNYLFLVGNVGPSAQVVKSLDRMGWKPPIVSHWGPAGGRFTELAGPSAKEVHFIQTYSFFGKQSPVGEKVLKALMAKYPDIKGPGDVTPAVGVANAYDAMMLTALAIENAGSTAGPAVRDGYYKIAQYQGLIKNYAKPFTPENHDAVNENDYVWTHFIDNQILPVDMKK